ncbi:hypothetical protein [Streptomyces brevispora]|uniref:Uncharacterized protein n=1 Tax=Streptomyces brevispora TaxID=887462 RepID=A0ABZ1FYX9_9ACTN|nr:hypothetical protein [Streptomyces brevispora]WSC12207.1 hypothetical protein OIE64_04660 [Streptomyces brevispora]
MRHTPVFRWVLALGLVLIGCSMGVYFAAPGFPEVRKVDLTVLDEARDVADRIEAGLRIPTAAGSLPPDVDVPR